MRAKIINKVNNFFRSSFSNGENLNSAQFFINAIIKESHADLRSATIIVVADKDNFISRLKDEIVNGEYPDYIEKIMTILAGSNLTPDNYFTLDDHLTAKGHEIIANEITKVTNPRIQK